MIDREWSLFSESILMGLRLGIVYDLVRLFRRIFFHNKFFRDLEDVIYWIMALLQLFFLQLRESQGILRIYSMAAVCFTMILYEIKISPIIINPLTNIIYGIKDKLTKKRKKIKIICKRIRRMRRKTGDKESEEKNKGKEKTAEPAGDHHGIDGRIRYDAGGSRE